MKPALVTGASGFVGWHVARTLLQKGFGVRALVRPSSRVPELDVERATGDLRDPDSVQRAVSGCGLVFHVAADYRLWAPDPSDLFRSNVDGTRNVLTAAMHAGAERVVYTSTVGCIGVPAGGIGNEQTPVSLDEMTGAYKRSKYQAEQVALEFAAKGFPVVIVNPTAPVGDHDFKPTPTGRIILDYLNGDMPAFVDTGLNLVDVADVAEGHWLAAAKGRAGERYILGCENLTLSEILARLANLLGRKAPRIRLPHFVAYAAGLVSTGMAQMTGKPPRVPIDAVRMARKKMFVSHEKAARELGFKPGSVDRALKNAIDWLQRKEADAAA